jgi:ribose transport system substrate-binding protein
MKLFLKITTISIFIILLFTGCGQNGKDGNGKALSEKTLHITMIGTTANDPVSLAAKQGAEDEIEKLMNKYSKLTISFDWKAPEKADHMKQGSLMINTIYDGTDMIVISCMDTIVLKEAIHMSTQMDIPVITYDSDIPGSERIAYIGPDHRKVGRDLIEMIQATSETGKIVVLAGSDRSYKHRLQIEGIKEAMEYQTGLELLEIIHHDDSPKAASIALSKAKQDHAGLTGVIMLDCWLFQDNYELDPLLLNDIDIVTVNALPSAFPYIEDGTLDACIGLATFKFGSQAMKLAVEKLYLEKDISEINTMKTIPVSIKNLGGWSRQYRAWGQDGIDKKYLTM